MMFAIENN